MKATDLLPVVAVLALGIGFYAGVKVGETRRIPAAEIESIRERNLRVFFAPGDVDRHGVVSNSVGSLQLSGDFHELTSYAGRRQSDR